MSLASRSARLAGAGSGLLALAFAAWGVFSFAGFTRTVEAKDELIDRYAGSVGAVERLRTLVEREASRARAYLITGYEPLLAERQQAKEGVKRALAELDQKLTTADEWQQFATITHAIADQEEVFDRAAAVRRKGGRSAERIGALYEAEVQKQREVTDAALASLAFAERRILLDAQLASSRLAQRAAFALLWAAAAAFLLASMLGVFLARAFHKLRDHEERLEAANKDLDAFAGRVAHDLRNVLGTLPLIAAIARQRKATDIVGHRIEKLARRASGIIDGLLAFSRAGKPPDEHAMADVHEVAAEVVDDLSVSATRDGVTVQVDTPSIGVCCSPQLLHLVLLNLVGNAIKFVAGREPRRVRITARREADVALIEVEDTGPGIPAQSLPRIFEPFYRAPGASADGTGLGLATVQRIVSAYGGHVSVESQQGKGTIVRVRLALARVQPEAPVEAVVTAVETSQPPGAPLNAG